MTRSAIDTRDRAIDEESAAPRTSVPLYVVGAGGMLAGEFLRLAAEHPVLRLAGAVSREPGRSLEAAHPHLDACATIDLAAAAAGIRAALAADAAARVALVLALPHGAAATAWRALRSDLGDASERVVVVDLSADYRLRDPKAYLRWYRAEHADASELSRFAYALPELFREELRGATRAAAPGCFATALQLATVPAAAAGLLDESSPWRYSAITGSSGSGAMPSAGTHHPYRHANLWAYGVGGHRHEAELTAALARHDLAPEICFVPHSGPFARGIHLTALLPLARAIDPEEARVVFRAAYEGEPFVRFQEDDAPDLRRVVGSNAAALAAFVRGRTLVVLAALDNLIKGGAGQGLQALNLMLGLPEGQSLPRHGLGVV